MTHDIAGPGTGPKTGASGAHGPSWDPEYDDPATPQERFHAAAWYAELDRERMDEVHRESQLHTATHTYRITYTGPAHPQAAIELELSKWPAKHYRWEAVEDE